MDGRSCKLFKYVPYLDKITELNAKSYTLTSNIRSPATDTKVEIRELGPIDLGEYAPTDRFER